VLKYLARYTHRVAISNQRLVSDDDGKVTFRWKDYAKGNRQRTMTLKGAEFLRRFLLHVLPCGFMRLRYYGFLANRNRAEKLRRARQLLTGPSSTTENEPSQTQKAQTIIENANELELCPQCKKGYLVVIARVGYFCRTKDPWSFDSS
jgi:hypothetical protein